MYLENRILKNLKVSNFAKMRYNKTSEDSMKSFTSVAKYATQEKLNFMPKNSNEFFKSNK